MIGGSATARCRASRPPSPPGADALPAAPTASLDAHGRRLACRALLSACVKERGGAQRHGRPAPWACDAPSVPAPRDAARVPGGCRGLPLLRPGASLAPAWQAATPWQRTGRGHGDVARPQRTPPRLSARAMAMVTEPPAGYGTDTMDLGLPRDLKAAHVARGGRRQAQHGGKKLEHPLVGSVCLLTTGVLIRVRRDAPIMPWVGTSLGSSGRCGLGDDHTCWSFQGDRIEESPPRLLQPLTDLLCTIHVSTTIDEEFRGHQRRKKWPGVRGVRPPVHR
jgi:hypothetical protein